MRQSDAHTERNARRELLYRAGLCLLNCANKKMGRVEPRAPSATVACVKSTFGDSENAWPPPFASGAP